jgi:hypothetical protein
VTTIPSPADLARRPAPRPAALTAPPRPKPPAVERPPVQLNPAQAIAPGQLEAGERFKATYTRGLTLSGLLPESRLMGHTLLWYAHHRTGRIAPASRPSFDQLADDTGFSPARVGVQIQILRERGWLCLTSIAEGPRRGRPRYDLTIPALVLERIRQQRAEHRQPGQTT